MNEPRHATDRPERDPEAQRAANNERMASYMRERRRNAKQVDTRTAEQRRAYFQKYNLRKRLEREPVSVARVAVDARGVICGLGGRYYYNESETRRHFCRDGVTPMYPERCSGENWRPGAVAAEVAAALERHEARRACDR
jgi:hypothetical protein